MWYPVSLHKKKDLSFSYFLTAPIKTIVLTEEHLAQLDFHYDFFKYSS